MNLRSWTWEMGLSLLLCLSTACNDWCKGELQPKTQTLELTYIAWACDCANWATPDDLTTFADNEDDELAKRCIFIEPAFEDLQLPDSLGYSNDRIRFTGRFYENKGFPDGYSSMEEPEPARVFRYTGFEVLESNYRLVKEAL